MNPKVVSNVLEDKDFIVLRDYFVNRMNSIRGSFDEFGRSTLGESSDPILSEYSNKLLPLAQSFFSPTLKPSYALFAEYSNSNVSLHKHKDANACTYTIDLVLYQDIPWGLWVEGKEYLANENEAILFWGEDQLHWREPVKNNRNILGVVFFHYVEPDHWWFTKGPEYVSVKREQLQKIISENNE